MSVIDPPHPVTDRAIRGSHLEGARIDVDGVYGVGGRPRLLPIRVRALRFATAGAAESQRTNEAKARAAAPKKFEKLAITLAIGFRHLFVRWFSAAPAVGKRAVKTKM